MNGESYAICKADMLIKGQQAWERESLLDIVGRFLHLQMPAEEVRPFVNAVPVYGLKVAAGRFSAPRAVQEAPQHEEVTNPSALSGWSWRVAHGPPSVCSWPGWSVSP